MRPGTHSAEPARVAAGLPSRLAFLLRSAGFRFALIYAALISVSAAALAVFLWWQTAGALDRQTESTISLDVANLNTKWLIGGVRMLVDTIDDRVRQNADNDSVYLLVDPELNRLAGNLLRWPIEIDRRPGWYELQVERGGFQVVTRVVSLILPGGYQMLVGRDIGVRVKLRELLPQALGLGVGVVAVQASLGALLVRKLFRGMIANVSATAYGISRGDLSRRVQLSGRGDEFDQLSESINDMLDRGSQLRRASGMPARLLQPGPGPGNRRA